jgi:GAF domain-containing protein
VENTQSVVAEFGTILDTKGLHAALGFLNARTRHRFTALYRFELPMLRSVCLYDRENPAVRIAGDSLMQETYCSFVWDRAGHFATADALGDERLISHPNRYSVQAYCGAPVVDDAGICVGTLCHFDGRPRLVPETEIPVMERIGRLLVAACAASRPADQRDSALSNA